jgi:phosphohistidine phosphatase SixA
VLDKLQVNALGITPKLTPSSPAKAYAQSLSEQLKSQTVNQGLVLRHNPSMHSDNMLTQNMLRSMTKSTDITG